MTIRDDALPELVTAWTALMQLAAAQGITFTIADYGGFRTAADTSAIMHYRDQDYALYVSQERQAGQTPVSEQAFRPIAPYGQSAHDYGAARDAAIVSAPAGMSSDDALAVLGSLAPQAGLRWGGTFTNPDPPHFELPWTLDQWAGHWTDFQNGTGDYAPGEADGDTSMGPTPTPAGQATLAALLVVALGGGLWLLLRRVL